MMFEIYLVGIGVAFFAIGILDPNPRSHGMFADVIAYAIVAVSWPVVLLICLLLSLLDGCQNLGRWIRS